MTFNIKRVWTAIFITVLSMVCIPEWGKAQDLSGEGNKNPNFFNPQISLNALFVGALYYDDHIPSMYSEPHEGIGLQELEFRFTSDVDAYFRMVAMLAYHGSAFEVEEAYVETLAIIPNFNFKLGKFLQPFGKVNVLHTHYLPFIEQNALITEIFGGEGLNTLGIETSILFPVPWYSQISLGLLRGDELFALPEAHDDHAHEDEHAHDESDIPLGNVSPLVHWKNLFDLTEDFTLELGGSYLMGHNEDVFAYEAHLIGGDLTFKWVSARSRGFLRSLAWQSEGILSLHDEETGGGVYSYVQAELVERVYAGYRYENTGLYLSDNDEAREGHTVMAMWVPSEFSALRLQHNFFHEDDEWHHKTMLQVNISIGAHPAHAY